MTDIFNSPIAPPDAAGRRLQPLTPATPAVRLIDAHWAPLARGLLAVCLILLMPWAAQAQSGVPADAGDPPGRIARLSLAEGGMSFAPADAPTAWQAVETNRPLTSGDRLWTGPGARSELHVGSTALRMNAQTSLDFITLDDDRLQLRLAQGTLQLRVRALFDGQHLEVDTPNLAFVIDQPGDYRLDVDAAAGTTRVVVLAGNGSLYGDNATPLALGSQQQASFSGTQLTPAAPGAGVQDAFDAWAAARDRAEDQSVSARYVPREVTGYQQLDAYGDWSQDSTYGAVWLPRALPANWAPYSAGQWQWIAPWGWTWVDAAPWGFAPSHYGRWARIGPRWGWVPGRLAPRPVYAPALVAFVGGGNGSGSVNWNVALGDGGRPRPGVGWFPLAPGEAFRPGYRSTPRYVTQVNNNIAVTNAAPQYRYGREPFAVTAVHREDFIQGRPVRGNPRPLSPAELAGASLLQGRLDLPRPAAGGAERWQAGAAGALPPAALLGRAPQDKRGRIVSREMPPQRPQALLPQPAPSYHVDPGRPTDAQARQLQQQQQQYDQQLQQARQQQQQLQRQEQFQIQQNEAWRRQQEQGYAQQEGQRWQQERQLQFQREQQREFQQRDFQQRGIQQRQDDLRRQQEQAGAQQRQQQQQHDAQRQRQDQERRQQQQQQQQQQQNQQAQQQRQQQEQAAAQQRAQQEAQRQQQQAQQQSQQAQQAQQQERLQQRQNMLQRDGQRGIQQRQDDLRRQQEPLKP